MNYSSLIAAGVMAIALHSVTAVADPERRNTVIRDRQTPSDTSAVKVAESGKDASKTADAASKVVQQKPQRSSGPPRR